MKYYIDGKLVRTSKNTYTHAVLFGDELVSCSSRYDLAVKEMDRRIANHNGNIADFKSAIKAIDEGKNFYWTKCCGHSYKAKVTRTREAYVEAIADCENRKTRYSIRELEAR